MSVDGSSLAESASLERWRAAVHRTLKNAGEVEALTARSIDGLPVGPLYPAGQGSVVWRGSDTPCPVLQRVDHPEANGLALADLEGGAGGLVLVTAHAPAARSFGLRLNSVEDFAAVLADIRLDAIRLRFDMHAAEAPDLWAEFRSFLARDPAWPGLLDLDLGLDPCGTLAVSPPGAGLWAELRHATLAALKQATEAGIPGFLLRADGRPVHEAGGSEAQELASVIASGIEALRLLEEGGFDLADAHARLSFSLAADADLYLTIAKFRALRRLWTEIAVASGLHPAPIAIQAETSWRMLTCRDPATNLLRNALAASAALLGGTDSITALPHTTAIGLPDAFARRVARNMPLVLRDESGLGRVADPAAGSGAFDDLTSGLCREAWRLFLAIEAKGGMAAALQSGWWPEQVSATRARRDEALRAGTQEIVGTTKYALPAEQAVAVLLEGSDEDAGKHSAVPLPARRDAALFEGGAMTR